MYHVKGCSTAGPRVDEKTIFIHYFGQRIESGDVGKRTRDGRRFEYYASKILRFDGSATNMGASMGTSLHAVGGIFRVW